MRRALALGALGAMWMMASGCAETPAASDPSSGVVTLPSPLVPPVRPDGVAPLPPGFEIAELMYTRGMVAFEVGAYAEAAPWLTRVAEALTPAQNGKSGETYRIELAANRVLAYHNAALAWVYAGNADEAEKMLNHAIETDPEIESSLRSMLQALPPRQTPPDAEGAR